LFLLESLTIALKIILEGISRSLILQESVGVSFRYLRRLGEDMGTPYLTAAQLTVRLLSKI